MSEIMRGLEAELSSQKAFKIMDLLNGIPIKNYKIYTPGCMVYPRYNSASDSGIILLQDLENLSMPDYIVSELSLHFFPLEGPVRKIKDYKDFESSVCFCSILYYDFAFLEIYAKDVTWIQIFEKNIKYMHPLSLQAKTSSSDERGYFF